MNKLFKVNLFVFILWAIELIAIVVWVLVNAQKQGDTGSQSGWIGFGLVLFLVTAIVFIITFIILFAWTARIYYQEKRLTYLFQEYLLVVAFMMLVGFLIKTYWNKNMDIRQFAFQVIAIPFFVLWIKVRDCVKEHSDDMVIRRK